MKAKSKKIPSMADGAYRFGGFDLYPSDRRLLRGKRVVRLSPKAFDALLVLVRKAGQLVRKEELVEALWPDTYVTEANLTNTIVALRKVVGRSAIQTVSKHGYRFQLPVLGEPGIGRELYETFVRAKDLTNERSLESMLAARDLYWLCIAENPGFAAAWAWLGRCARFIEKFSGGDRVSFELADAAIRRALSLDPDLACAHHFYTQLQADCGESEGAMARLLERLRRRGGEPESFAGLVQVLRFCGLLDESAAAHSRAKAMDPTVLTSVAHTHFLRGEYEAAIETYGPGKGYYLDAASWAALGDTSRAVALLRDRVAGPHLSPLIRCLIGSLLSILDGNPGEAEQAMARTEIVREPEVIFYFARHFSLLGNAVKAVDMLARACAGGFWASRSIERDPAWSAVRKYAAFRGVFNEIKRSEANAKRVFEQAGGPDIVLQ